MAGNTYSKMSISALRTLATQMWSIIGASPTTYGATLTQVTNLNAANNALGTDVVNTEAAKEAYRAAVQVQNADKATLVANIALLARQAYNKAGITDAQIAATGLAIHDHSPSPITPSQPAGLAATAFADGSVFLKWTKNNPYGVNFFIEASVDGGPWTQVYATKRGSIKLYGFAPGTPTSFRIKAENRGLVSAPSNESVIYPTSAQASFLQIAA